MFLFSCFLLFNGCEDSTSVEPENYLIGKWLDINSCDSCLIYEFNPDNSLYRHKIGENSIDTLSYKLLSKDSINIVYKSNKNYKIERYTEDSIEILGFTQSLIPEINSTILKRIEK